MVNYYTKFDDIANRVHGLQWLQFIPVLSRKAPETWKNLLVRLEQPFHSEDHLIVAAF